MSDFSLNFVLQKKQAKIINDMAKINIKSEKTTPFGGIFHVRDVFPLRGSRYRQSAGIALHVIRLSVQ